MTLPTDSHPDETIPSKGPAREFAAFCAADKAHRRNAEPGFDEQFYDEAVALVIDRLAALQKDTRG